MRRKMPAARPGTLRVTWDPGSEYWHVWRDDRRGPRVVRSFPTRGEVEDYLEHIAYLRGPGRGPRLTPMLDDLPDWPPLE